ncbi:MAG: glycosyltransferase family 9 protein [Candidatus Omnitrophota bacterium]
MHPGHRFAIIYFLDQTVGALLCGFLGLLHFPLKLIARRSAAQAPARTVLVLKWFGIGSLVFLQPLLKNIKKTYPGCRIIFLTFEGNRTLLEAFGNCDEICGIRLNALFPWNVLRAVFHLRRARVDAGIDLEFYSAFSTFMLFLSGARRRIGFNLPYFWRRSLLTDPVFFNYFRHVTEVYRSAGRLLGVDYQDLRPGPLPVRQEARDNVSAYLRENGWPGNTPLVGINVNAGEMAYSRRWPKSYFLRLMRGILAQKPDACLVLTGSREEKTYVDEVFAGLETGERSRVINSAGALSLLEFIALISRLSLFITNDSGPLHLAYAQDIPTVSFWGPGSPAFYGLEGQRHMMFYERLDCSPCLYIYRTEPGYLCGSQARCLREITPEKVLPSVLRML